MRYLKSYNEDVLSHQMDRLKVIKNGMLNKQSGESESWDAIYAKFNVSMKASDDEENETTWLTADDFLDFLKQNYNTPVKKF